MSRSRSGRKATSAPSESDEALIEVRESQLTIDEQFATLREHLWGLRLENCGDSCFEVGLDLIDSEMVVRRLDFCPPLRAQIVTELRRVADLYRRMADMAEKGGLDAAGNEVSWFVPENPERERICS
jgi:hypothetical protein